MENALLIDYKFCTGCHTCEVACQKYHNLDPEQFGIKLTQIGPDQISDRTWQYEFVPVPTDRCDRCVGRTAKGKPPMCVQHCQAGCIQYGSIADMAKKMTDRKFVLFA